MRKTVISQSYNNADYLEMRDSIWYVLLSTLPVLFCTTKLLTTFKKDSLTEKLHSSEACT